MPFTKTHPVAGRGETIDLDIVACREAENVLLDRRYFVLSAEAHRKFISMLDRPSRRNARLRRLLESKAPWER